MRFISTVIIVVQMLALLGCGFGLWLQSQEVSRARDEALMQMEQAMAQKMICERESATAKAEIARLKAELANSKSRTD